MVMTLDLLIQGFKKLLLVAFLIGIIIAVYIYHTQIIDFFVTLTNPKKEIVIKDPNPYKVPWDFNYVQNTDDFEPENYQELLNIFYTVVNSGWEDFTFYCPEEYKECLNDVASLADNQQALSLINNYVHPYNSYQTMDTMIVGKRRIDIKVTRLYQPRQIEALNKVVNNVLQKLIKNNMTEYDKIRTIHDFIVNNATYDRNMTKPEKKTPYHSSTAYGPLIEGYAICGGYSDAMQLFLFKLGIKNYKVSSEKHIWNFVYTNKKWYHLDLTWDDPITIDGSNRLKHTYFLITSSALEKLNKEDNHTYDKTIFSEAK